MRKPIAALVFAILAAAACTDRPALPVSNAMTTASGLQLERVNFADLPDWNEGAQFDALLAFRRSCNRLTRLPGDTPIGPGGFAGQASDWRAACQAASIVGAGEDDGARSFFQHLFRPYRLTSSDGSDKGLLTGYYVPRVMGSRRQAQGFDVPLYRRPPDLAAIHGDSSMMGHLVAGRWQPYYSRAEIDEGALRGRNLELVWLCSDIEAFFVSIQGSAVVALDDGTTMRIGYAGDNGHAYTAIGRILIDQGAVKAEDMSLQTLTAWLRAHPEQARSLMERNPRYIFFQEMTGEGPVGSEGVPLTAGRSLAVDTAYLPLGAPVYIDTSDPKGSPLRRLMLAQDTGRAIKGPLRGDVYWGGGALAEATAGAMKSSGRFYLLLPIGVTPTVGG